MAIFGFKSISDEVLNHWIAVAEQFSFPPQEFYELVEKALTARQIPGLAISRVAYREGGLLSDQRIYLHLIRERLAFDTCAAPFGVGYFFSCRTVYSPVVVRLWHILLALLCLSLLGALLYKLLGFTYGLVSLAALVIAIGQVFRNTVALNFSDLDTILLKLPGIGPIYERWFRVDSYYRQDTRLVYLETVPKLVRELAEEITAHKGVKLVSQYQRAPVLGELYKPLPAKPDAPPP